MEGWDVQASKGSPQHHMPTTEGLSKSFHLPKKRREKCKANQILRQHYCRTRCRPIKPIKNITIPPPLDETPPAMLQPVAVKGCSSIASKGFTVVEGVAAERYSTSILCFPESFPSISLLFEPRV